MLSARPPYDSVRAIDKRTLYIFVSIQITQKKWFKFFNKEKVAPCIRLKAKTKVGGIPVWALFKGIPTGEVRWWYRPLMVYGVPLRVCALRDAHGHLLYVATLEHGWNALERYSKRWTIKCTFGSLKRRGFDLERTGVTQPARLERLFWLVILAWVACLRTGVWLDTQRPIKKKKHGRRAMSLVRYGAESLANGLRWRLDGLEAMLSALISPFPVPGAV